MRPSMRSILFCLLRLCIFTAFSHLHAQSNSGSISGTVTDPSGAVIPGASVSIQNPSAPTPERQPPTPPAISISRTSPSIPIT